MAVRPPPSNSSTAYVPPRPIIKPTMSKRPIRRRNIKRPPPSQSSPLRPAPPQPTPITPTTPQPSVVRPTSPTNQPPPRVTRQTMHDASRSRDHYTIYAIHANSTIHNSNTRQMASTWVPSTNRSIFKWQQQRSF
ncbi:proline-rich receptor-like protein kinase PERK9 [Arachis ipaensis]|nr:proline-rich receptor-like protein kinase PERK9 [Arachis ipaensis]